MDGDNSPVHAYAPGRLEAPNDSTDSNPESRHASNELPRSQYEPQSPQQQQQQPRSSAIHEIVIANTGGPLGIHVVPHKDEATGYVWTCYRLSHNTSFCNSLDCLLPSQ